MTTLTRPVALKPDFDRIPAALRETASWVLWRYEQKKKNGEWTKPPKTVTGEYARTNDPATWTTFEQAQAAYQRGGFDGVGLVLTDGIAGVDLDHAVGDDGAPAPWAADTLQHFTGTYRERSPSGEGFRIFTRGKPGRCGKGGPNKHLEVYAKGSPRYLTVTGHALDDAADVTEGQAALDWLHEAHFAKKPAGNLEGIVVPAPGVAPSLRDEEVIERARKAANGAKFSELWAGGLAGHPSQNEADSALVGLLRFWTRGDAAQIDRLFRRSGLMRDKWDSRRGDSTYGANTIASVLKQGGAHFGDGISTAGKFQGDGGAGNIKQVVEDASLRPLSVTELLARPIPAWLLRGVIPEHAFGVIFGASGTGKSFVELDMAAAIARGVPWFGRRVRRSGVIYVAGEGHLTLRLRAYLEHHALPADELARLRVVPANINLVHPEADLEALVAEIRKVAGSMGGVGLVVLDTLNAMMPGGDENTSADMGQMVASARRVMEGVGCTVVYVHHSGKDESKGSRGHSSLRAACDFEMQVSAIGSERVVETVKQRDGETGQRFGFRLRPVDLGPDPDPEADADDRLSSCVVEPLDRAPQTTKPIRRDVALDALREVLFEFGDRLPATSAIPPGVKAVTLDQWKARWTLRTGYDDAAGESVRVNFDKDRRALLAAGAIQISKPYVWIA